MIKILRRPRRVQKVCERRKQRIMKNRWVKRIATAVTALALAASVFTGLGNSAKAVNGTSYDVQATLRLETDAHQLTPIGTADLTVRGRDIDHFLDNGTGVTIMPAGVNNTPEGTLTVEVLVTAQSADVSINPVIDSINYSFSYEGNDYSGSAEIINTFSDAGMRFCEAVDLVDVASADDDDDDDNSGDPADTGAPSTHKHHTHNWEWTALVNATENQDGTYAMKCTRCNKVDESTITVIAKESVTSDKNLQILGSAKPGETIKLDTKGTAAFNQYFIAELMKHSDSPLSVDFEYNNKKYTLTAPAGFNWSATLDEKGWAGFLRVARDNAEVTVVER